MGARKMQSAIFWILLVLLTVGCRRAEPLYIGVVLDEDGADAARLVQAELVRAGRLDGRPVRLWIVSPAAHRDSARLFAALDSLAADSNVVAVVGPGNQGPSIAATRFLNERQVPHVVPTPNGAERDTTAPFSFQLVADGGGEARLLVAQTLKLEPAGRIAVVHADDDYGRSLRGPVVGELTRRRARVVFESTFEPGADTASLRALALAIEEANPDALIWLGRGRELWMILAPLRAALPQLVVVGSDAVESELLYRPGGEGLSGLLFVRFADPQAEEARVADFRLRYATWVARQPTSRSMLAYDAIHLVVEALRSGARTREEVREYLASVGRTREAFTGLGGEIRFDERGRAIRPYLLGEVTDYGVQAVDAPATR